MNGIAKAGFIIGCAVIFVGCATTPNTSSGSNGIAYKDDKDLQRVFVADGFDFSGYDTLYIGPVDSNVNSHSAEEAQVLEKAKRTLPQEFASEIAKTQVFKNVVTRESDIPSGAKTLKMANTITQHEKGGGGARYFAGLYGAGQPVLKVEGKVSDADKLVFAYEAVRHGDSGGARMFGGFRSDESIQAEDIQDLAKDMAAFIDRTQKHQPRK